MRVMPKYQSAGRARPSAAVHARRTASNWNYQDARLVSKNTKYTRPADLAHQQGTEDTPMSRLHGLLRRINISQLHCNQVEVVTPWHPEWNAVAAMVEEALRSEAT